jgi:hypothetical protein
VTIDLGILNPLSHNDSRQRVGFLVRLPEIDVTCGNGSLEPRRRIAWGPYWDRHCIGLQLTAGQVPR